MRDLPSLNGIVSNGARRVGAPNGVQIVNVESEVKVIKKAVTMGRAVNSGVQI